jgi:anion-transporting  ArsA/GET3 family ATPase
MSDIKETQLIAVFGVGGVGKTTTAAGLGLALAQKGYRVAVTTVDPAKRLAQIMGLKELTSKPQKVFVNELEQSTGSLHALWIDSAHVLEDLIRNHASLFKDVDSIIHNRLFKILQNQLGGIEEYLGLEKILELKNSKLYDYCILDTPPSRQGLDYLEAPEHLIKFLDEGVLKYFLGGVSTSDDRIGSGLFAKFFQMGSENALALFKKFLGSGFLTELAALLNALVPLRKVFLSTAVDSRAWFSNQNTRFLVVSTLENYPLEESIIIETALRRRFSHAKIGWVLIKFLTEEFRSTTFKNDWLNSVCRSQTQSLTVFLNSSNHSQREPTTFIQPFDHQKLSAQNLSETGLEILKAWEKSNEHK